MPIRLGIAIAKKIGGSMLRRKLYTKIRRRAHRFYSIILLAMILVFNGCTTHKGDLRFNSPSTSDIFNISGRINLPEIIETEAARASLTTLSDFSNFKLTAGEVTTQADKAGNYSLTGVAFSDSLVIGAVSNKIALLRRVTADELCYSDLSNIEINVNTTAEAMVYLQGVLLKKDLTPADIRAREYSDGIASLTSAIRLSMQLPKNSISSTNLQLPAVVSASKEVAQKCISRDNVLKEANTVLRHAFLRKDLDLIKLYISPSFGNDWDSESSWNDVVSYFEKLFAKNDFVSWRKHRTDRDCVQRLAHPLRAHLRMPSARCLYPHSFKENSTARIRTKVNAIIRENTNDEIACNNTWTFDALWRLEGTIWKLYRNMPYKDTHPTQVDADLRWGEIAAAHKELIAAINSENLDVINNRVSDSFRNAFDGTSTKNEIMLVAAQRFNKMDLKIADYSIESIKFTESDFAEVTCSGRIKVINILLGKDIDSGPVQAVVIWHKEDGVWKIYRDLPYKFCHPTTIK